MATISAPTTTTNYSGKALCRLIGIACLAGFAVDLFVLSYPINFGALEWRVSFFQQVGDRSIILLFGLALLMYGFMEFRNWRRRFAAFCLALGVIFQLSCILVIRDSSTLQKQTLSRITTQATQLETQIQQARSNPELSGQVTPEQLETALQQLSQRSDSLQQNAKTGIFRAGIASVGNLAVVGLALLGLGRYGMKPPKDRV